MKKIAFLLSMMVLIVSSIWADPARVNIEQTVQIGNKILKPRSTPVPIPASFTEPIYLTYDFTVTADKDNDQAFICCRIQLPSIENLEINEYSGFMVTDNNTPLMTVDRSTLEIFLPQSKSATAFLKIKLDPTKIANQRILTNFSFTHYKRPLLSSLAMKVGAGAGIVVGAGAGIITGLATKNPAIGLATGTAAAAVVGGATTKIMWDQSKETVDEIKAKYPATSMPLSSAGMSITFE